MRHFLEGSRILGKHFHVGGRGFSAYLPYVCKSSKILIRGGRGLKFWLRTPYHIWKWLSESLSHRWLILSHYDSFSYLGEGVTWKISNYAIAIIGNFEDLTLAVTRRKCPNPPNFLKKHQIGGNQNRQIFGKTAKTAENRQNGGNPPNFRGSRQIFGKTTA